MMGKIVIQSNKKNKIAVIVFSILALFLSVYIRTLNFSVESSDMHEFVIPWYNFIVGHGVFHSFAYNFYNYNPPYLYLLALTTLFRAIPKIMAIKLLSTIFDVVAAYAVYRIVSLIKQDRYWGIFAFFTVLLTPVVFIESSHWGQCDIIYTAFLLFMLDSLIRKKYIRGLIFFSIAFVFKFQAVFLAPIMLYLLIKKKIPVTALLYSLGIYFLSILPAWLAGRSLISLIKIYLSQAETYKMLSMNAPTCIIPGRTAAISLKPRSGWG